MISELLKFLKRNDVTVSVSYSQYNDGWEFIFKRNYKGEQWTKVMFYPFYAIDDTELMVRFIFNLGGALSDESLDKAIKLEEKENQNG